MKLFVFEYASAGGSSDPSVDASYDPPNCEPFLEEGMAMLSSLIGDLKQLDTLHLTTMLRPDIAKSENRFSADEIVEPASDFQDVLTGCMESADLLFIIAPETDGILYSLTKKGEELGKTIVGSSSKAAQILGDKLKTWELLNGSFAMPETKTFSGKPLFSPSVIKPRYGAGSEDIFIAENGSRIGFSGSEKIVQPLIDGDHLSAGFVASESSVRLLGVCRQSLNIGRRITFEGVAGPINFHSPEQLTEMANAIHKKIPGLKGYFGLDFIDRPEGIMLIEVNPRLTTSYPVYSASISENLAELLLESAGVAVGEV